MNDISVLINNSLSETTSFKFKAYTVSLFLLYTATDPELRGLRIAHELDTKADRTEFTAFLDKYLGITPESMDTRTYEDKQKVFLNDMRKKADGLKL